METLRIHFLSALLVPVAWAIACGGSDNPSSPANSNAGSSGTGAGGGSSGASGTSTSTGGSSTGTGGSSSGTGGSATGTGGRMGIPMDPIVPDPTCPDLELPEAGTLPDGGTFMPGAFGDAGPNNFKGCCDPSGICGWALQNSFSFMGTSYNISQCVTPEEARRFGMMGGQAIDAGPSKPCTYKAP
jgi:hypothetical protein